MSGKEIALRAAKTFLQAFVPVVIAALRASDALRLDELKAVLLSALVSGAAAGLSAVWNLFLAAEERCSRKNGIDKG